MVNNYGNDLCILLVRLTWPQLLGGAFAFAVRVGGATLAIANLATASQRAPATGRTARYQNPGAASRTSAREPGDPRTAGTDQTGDTGATQTRSFSLQKKGFRRWQSYRNIYRNILAGRGNTPIDAEADAEAEAEAETES